MLLRDLGAPIKATAWEGWDGDRWVAADCDGRREFVWLTAWDSETDAAEFAASYDRIAPAVAERAAMVAPPVARVSEREVWIATPGLAALAAQLDRFTRRARVANLAEVRAFASPRAPSPGSPGSAARD